MLKPSIFPLNGFRTTLSSGELFGGGLNGLIKEKGLPVLAASTAIPLARTLPIRTSLGLGSKGARFAGANSRDSSVVKGGGASAEELFVAESALKSVALKVFVPGSGGALVDCAGAGCTAKERRRKSTIPSFITALTFRTVVTTSALKSRMSTPTSNFRMHAWSSPAIVSASKVLVHV